MSTLGTTGGAVISVELWVLVSAVLLLAKFIVGSAGHLIFSKRGIKPFIVQLLHILNYYSVTYTLGLMKPSSDENHRVRAKVEDFFQVWAVLIVTMQDSVRIGRPYRPVKMTLVDLLSSLWAANQLRVHTELRLKVPVWLIWSIHALRVIWFYFSSKRASEANLDSIKLVSDYMMTSQHTDDHAHPDTMQGYKYIVLGEEEQSQMSVGPPSFTLKMDAKQLLTVEDVWQNAENKDNRLLSTASDRDHRFKDVCLSFALYKLIRRRFYDIPIAEASHPATASRLVADAILEEGENGCYERALRITEVELSFLRDSVYSKHAAVFCSGFPWVRLALSLLMTTAALYLAYAVRYTPGTCDIPGTCDVVTGKMQKTVRISHGVPITLLVIAIVVCRELTEVGVYVMSQWSKVLIICRYIRLKEGSWLQHFITEMVARVMFFCIRRGQWDQQIHQYNILMLVLRKKKLLHIPIPWVRFRKVKLGTQAKKAAFRSLKALITEIPSAQVNHSSQEEMNKLLASYFTKAFTIVNENSSSPSPPLINDPASSLDGESETYKILIWHIATSLCQIKAIQRLEREKQERMDLYDLKVPGGDPAAMWQHYMTAVSLSNYCAYLITQGLVPDNGLVSEKIFHAVRYDVRHDLARCYKMEEVQDKCSKQPADKSIFGIGAELSESLMSKYDDVDNLWDRLAKFWMGYLLHLSASTRAAKHQTHLQGRGEFTTHLWVMLSHAGFLGKTSHGEQMLDPVDRNDA